ncbi:hypothetical protein EDB83DRAFT_2316944 [Lactarius deliciosus]|nr:hypothetical protein EDB83DRAFT_2316944 [Lactarius deliciosus]
MLSELVPNSGIVLMVTSKHVPRTIPIMHQKPLNLLIWRMNVHAFRVTDHDELGAISLRMQLSTVAVSGIARSTVHVLKEPSHNVLSLFPNSCLVDGFTFPVDNVMTQLRDDVITEDIQVLLDRNNLEYMMLSAGPSLDSTQIADPQGQPQLICVEVTVLRAHNVPEIKNRFGGKTRFYVTIAHTTTKKTEGVQIEGQTVQWNQRLDAFKLYFLQTPPSRLTLCLYAKSLARRDILIGKYEIPVEPQINVPFVLSNGDGQAGQSTQAVTLYLTISVSMNEAHFALPTDLVVTQLLYVYAR